MYIDGITWTLHDPITIQDHNHMNELEEFLECFPNISRRLYVIPNDFNLNNVNEKSWNVVRHHELNEPENCPIPENEDLYILRIK